MYGNTLRLACAVLAIGVSAIVRAEPPAAPQSSWEANCRLPAGDAHLRFISASGDAYEDDMRVEYLAGGRTVVLPVASGLYYPQGAVSATPSLCDKVGAFLLDDGSVLLLLSIDNRPSWNRATLVLLDPAQGPAVDVRERVAEIKDSSAYAGVAVKRAKGGFLLRLIREQVPDANSDGPEAYIEGWMEVRAAGGRLRTRWVDR